MALESEFLLSAEQIVFTTQAIGDNVIIRGVHLGTEAAASLTTLINDPNGNLIVNIKRETEPE